MRKIFCLLFIASSLVACAQKTDDIVNAKEVQRIESVLAADDMRGRRAGSPDIDRAAAFIAAEFKKAGLQPFQGKSFLQEFSMIRTKPLSFKAEADGQEMEAKNLVVVSTDKKVNIDESSGYETDRISAGENMNTRARSLLAKNKNLLVLVDTAFSRNFSRLANFTRQQFRMNNTVVFILGTTFPRKFRITQENSVEETKFMNVVGILPGRSRKHEYVIFSGHFDHLGIARQPIDGDSIYNGANDDAAGTTAVILLANYFKKLKNNKRTLVFAAFTAEEIGGFGSQYFSRQFDPEKVMAMFNIEMIGTESKWGRNSAYITGYEKTDMGSILQKNLEGTAFKFYPDPFTNQNLFYRSDNATLARLGVPAHTISTSKMDSEPNYHKVTDEISTLDMENMAEIIRAVAISSKSIISGKDTPTRVKQEDLR